VLKTRLKRSAVTVQALNWFEEANADGEGRHLGPTPDAEAAEDSLDMALDRAGTDSELLSDLLVGETAGDELHHLTLTRREVTKALKRHIVQRACPGLGVSPTEHVRSVQDQAQPPTHGSKE